MILTAKAKINLRLKCLGKRNDGFHELEMINMKINLRDYIIVKKSSINKISYNTKILDPKKDTLVLKLAEKIQEIYNISEKIHIHIIKKIPIGAGLGGGSADAAAVLLYMNKKFNLRFYRYIFKNTSSW